MVDERPRESMNTLLDPPAKVSVDVSFSAKQARRFHGSFSSRQTPKAIKGSGNGSEGATRCRSTLDRSHFELLDILTKG